MALPLLDVKQTMATLKAGFSGTGPFYRTIPKQPARRFVDAVEAVVKTAQQIPGNIFTGKSFGQRRK